MYSPEPSPEINVAMRGVLVLLLTLDRNSNNRPSLDIAYRIRGIGNKQPNKLFVIKILRTRLRNGFAWIDSKIILRGQKSKYCATGNYVFNYRQSQVLINDRQWCVNVLNNKSKIKILLATFLGEWWFTKSVNHKQNKQFITYAYHNIIFQLR